MKLNVKQVKSTAKFLFQTNSTHIFYKEYCNADKYKVESMRHLLAVGCVSLGRLEFEWLHGFLPVELRVTIKGCEGWGEGMYISVLL